MLFCIYKYCTIFILYLQNLIQIQHRPHSTLHQPVVPYTMLQSTRLDFLCYTLACSRENEQPSGKNAKHFPSCRHRAAVSLNAFWDYLAPQCATFTPLHDHNDDQTTERRRRELRRRSDGEKVVSEVAAFGEGLLGRGTRRQ